MPSGLMTPNQVLRAATVATATIAVVLLVVWIVADPHWAAVHTGTDYLLCKGSPCPNQPYYNFWSGIGSDLGEYVIAATVVSGVLGWYSKHNCHEQTCWRLGKHPTEGGTFVLCRRHHPDTAHLNGRSLSLDFIHDHHRQALGRAAVPTQGDTPR